MTIPDFDLYYKRQLAQIRGHEGFRSHVYQDDKGYLTIGYGTNLSIGLTMREADLLLRSRFDDAIRFLWQLFSEDQLSLAGAVRVLALAELTYWIGDKSFLGYENKILAFKKGDFEQASKEMLCSRLGTQYPSRTQVLAEQLQSGQFSIPEI